MSRLWNRLWNDDMTFSPSIWYEGIIRAKAFPLMTSLLYWWAARFFVPNVRILDMLSECAKKTDVKPLLNSVYSLQIIAKYTQIALYAIFVRTPAQPSTSESTFIHRDRKRIHKIIIVAFFLFTVLKVDRRVQGEGNYYRMLGIPLDADQKMAKKAFRIM